MATGTLISLEEYLSTTYRPDCDYVDGEVLERNLGEYPHSRLQAALIGLVRFTGERLEGSSFRVTTPSDKGCALPGRRYLCDLARRKDREISYHTAVGLH